MSVVTIEINGVKKELKRNDVIFCKTEEEAQMLFKALTKVDYTWCTGSELDGSNTYMRKEGRGYNIDRNGLMNCDLEWYQDPNDGEKYNIMYFEDLFKPQIKIDPNELYDLVKKIVLDKSDGGLSITELYECFGTGSYSSILLNNTSKSLIESYNKWMKLKEAENEIKVGDVFEASENADYKFIVLKEKDEDGEFKILDSDYDTIYIREDTLLNLYKKVGHKETLDLF